MKTRLEKFGVCPDCYGVGVIDTSCGCMEGNYKTIELEFEVCECCGSVIDDGNPADTPFNDEQIEKHNKTE